MQSVYMLMLVLMASCLSGCSEQPTRFQVAGKVLIDGEPLTTGSIQFVPVGGRPVASKIDKDGSFRLSEMSVKSKTGNLGVPQGKYRIGVSATEIVDEDQGEVLRHIPARYADFRTSDLDVEITETLEDMLIELTWEGAEETAAAAETDDEALSREETPQDEPVSETGTENEE